tara:strand:- start:11664 stop:12797 length:1134 start_codon:yes stop_codon:yes gene_type:complete
MNKILGVIIVIALVASFSYGISVGTYKIFPYEYLNSFKDNIELNEEISKNSNVYNFESRIDIQDKSDIQKIRDELIFYIWNSPPSIIFPTDNSSKTLPTIVEKNIIDTRFSNLENLKEIDKFSIEMENNVNSIVYLLHAENDNNELIIYHQGHDGGFIDGKSTINYFLKNGYSVMAFSMPLVGMNSQPTIDIENVGLIKFFDHDQFRFLESENFSPLSYFFTPINHSLNYLDLNYNFKNYHMVGISGGGWTTTIYPALDTRISKSFAVSGSLPIPLRINSQDIGDYEQIQPELYNIANYSELYIMSSYGENRTFNQIFNKYDPCCFSGSLFNEYESKISNIVSKLNFGDFNVYLDDTHNEHKISEYAQELILEKIAQ